MARKRHSDKDILKLLREIELKSTEGDDVASGASLGMIVEHVEDSPSNDFVLFVVVRAAQLGKELFLKI